jgi:putative serine protease PepD
MDGSRRGQKPQHGRSKNRWLTLAVLVAALVVGGVVSGCTSSATTSSATTSSSGGSGQVSACNVTSVANQVIPSVVTISAKGPSGAGTGSGEVIQSDGYILTNNHVIAIAANGGSVEVQFSDGQTAPATITGRDPQTDLAVLKVDTSAKLKVIAMGSSSSVQVGEAAVVIGAPLGLSGTVTSGIITKINGQPATNTVQLQELTLTKKPGDTVQLEYWRNGQTATATVTLGSQP